jgi:excisionase family DNA binding protein
MPTTLLPPSQTEISQLKTALAQRDRCVLIGADGKAVKMPTKVFDLLTQALHAWTRGNGVTLTVQTKLLSTQQAANLIGCSRQHVVSLMDSGAIPGRRVGTHRRMKLQDVLSFIEAEDRQRDIAMEKLVRHTEEMGGYDQ